MRWLSLLFGSKTDNQFGSRSTPNLKHGLQWQRQLSREVADYALKRLIERERSVVNWHPCTTLNVPVTLTTNCLQDCVFATA